MQGLLPPAAHRLPERARGASRRSQRARQWPLGPGLITGACNNDPSSVGTYSQVGAQFGFGLSWTLLFSYPLVVAIQEISARIGHVTGRGIAGNLQRHYPPWLACALVALLSGANVFNLAADLGAMGVVMKLTAGGPALLWVCLLGLACMLLGVLTARGRYVRLLKWSSLCLLSYVVSAFLVDVPWREVGSAMIRPSLSASPQYLTAILAVLGTTISPYLFFWQAQQEAEAAAPAPGTTPAPRLAMQARAEFARIRLDTLTGMGLSSVVALCILITTASTLHVHGVQAIRTAAEAAEALRSVAGNFTFGVFALGLLGAGLLTVPPLAASAAYALGEVLPAGRRGRRPARSRSFYAAIVAAAALGGALNFTSITPMQALYGSAVLNGVVCLPLMLMIMHLATRTRLAGAVRLPLRLVALGWAATAVMACGVLALAACAFG